MTLWTLENASYASTFYQELVWYDQAIEFSEMTLLIQI